MTEIGIEQARKTLGDIASRALYAGQGTYLTRNGRRVAAIVPLEHTMHEVLDIDDTTAIETVGKTLDGRRIGVKVGGRTLYMTPDAAERLSNALAGAMAGECGLAADVLQTTTDLFAKYTQEGRVSIVTGDDEQVSDLGYFDADGGTWEDEVREIVRAAGWEPVSGWDNTRVGEDNEDNSILVVKRAD
jgi:antitoxin (DNA-binding transcriptional repressor) of toxin-antitoxin stability system